MQFFQWTGFDKSKKYFNGIYYLPYMMGLGQGNRAAPPSWIQLSVIMVTMFKQLNLGVIINNSISDVLIHSMGALFIDNTNMYMWRENIFNPEELWSNSDQDQTVELPPECNGRDVKTREMLLVLA